MERNKPSTQLLLGESSEHNSAACFAGASEETKRLESEEDGPPAYHNVVSKPRQTRLSSTHSEHHDGLTEVNERPVKWLQFNVFLCCLCFVALCESCIVRGYSGAILTTLQKQFKLTTRQSGLITTSYEFGHIPFVVAVSLISRRYNRSKLIGIGGIMMAIGCVVYLIPMFLAFGNPSAIHNVAINVSANSLDSSMDGPSLCVAGNRSEYTDCGSSGGGASTFMVAILCLAQCILGIGASPIYTLGLTYLYENIPKRSRYPVYSGMMYAFAGLGPVLGFGMGSYFLTIYIFPWNVPIGVNGPTHPQFLGAWWIGLLVCICITFCSAVPLFFFPDNVAAHAEQSQQQADMLPSSSRKGNGKAADDSPVNMEFGRNCSDIIRGIKTVLQSRIWLGMTIILIAENSVVVWFATYFPKYLETTFRVQRQYAGIMTGLILIPAACSGVVTGGLITKKLRRTVAILKYMFGITVANFLFELCCMFMRCDMLPFAGVTSTHNLADMHLMQQSTATRSTDLNQTLLGQCNAHCDCSLYDYYPVCAKNGQQALTFYNPCFAGCKRMSSFNFTESSESSALYFDCSCAASSLASNFSSALHNFSSSNPAGFSITNGSCDVECGMLIPFMVVIFIVVFLVTSGQNPTLILTLQSVGDAHRSFALACQTFFIRTLAYLPSPIYFGQLFDSQCVLTQPDRCSSFDEEDVAIGFYNRRGYCVMYDTLTLPYIMLGSTLLLKAIALLTIVFCWISEHRWIKKTKRTNNDVDLDMCSSPDASAAQNGNSTSNCTTEVKV